MRTTSLASPLRLEWLLEQNARLDARPYVGGAYEARDLLNRLTVPVEPLSDLTCDHPPDDWTVLHNVELPDHGHWYEVGAFVVLCESVHQYCSPERPSMRLTSPAAARTSLSSTA